MIVLVAGLFFNINTAKAASAYVVQPPDATNGQVVQMFAEYTVDTSEQTWAPGDTLTLTKPANMTWDGGGVYAEFDTNVDDESVGDANHASETEIPVDNEGDLDNGSHRLSGDTVTIKWGAWDPVNGQSTIRLLFTSTPSAPGPNSTYTFGGNTAEVSDTNPTGSADVNVAEGGGGGGGTPDANASMELDTDAKTVGGNTGNATLTLTIPAPGLDNDDTVIFDFPSNVDASSVGYVSNTFGGGGDFNCGVSGQTVTCTAGGVINAAVGEDIVLNGIDAASAASSQDITNIVVRDTSEATDLATDGDGTITDTIEGGGGGGGSSTYSVTETTGTVGTHGNLEIEYTVNTAQQTWADGDNLVITLPDNYPDWDAMTFTVEYDSDADNDSTGEAAITAGTADGNYEIFGKTLVIRWNIGDSPGWGTIASGSTIRVLVTANAAPIFSNPQSTFMFGGFTEAVDINPGGSDTINVSGAGGGGGDPQTGGVTSVIGADTEDLIWGLTGEDFTITWTPLSSAPAGYNSTMIFVVPNATAITSVNVMNNGCGGNSCEPRGFYFDYDLDPDGETNIHMLPPYAGSDSEGNDWNAGTTYKACVYTQATVTTLDCSDGFAVASEDAVDDAGAPFIHHMSAINYISGQELIIYASIQDDQTTPEEFAAETDGAYIKMYYGGAEGDPTTEGVVTRVTGTNLWKMETNTSLTTNMKYYIKAADKAGNIRYFTSDPDVDMSANPTNSQAAAVAFAVNPVSAGSISVSGSILDASTTPAANIADSAFVVLNGLGIAGVATSGGAYVFNSLPAGYYDIMAAKSGYAKQQRSENITENTTGIDITLNPGEASFAGGGGGSFGGFAGGTPYFMFSSPPISSNMAPLDQPILAGFSQALDSNTVNDKDATGSNDNIYLTTDDGTTKIPGAVQYCPSKTTAGTCAALMDMDENVIVFTPTSDLTANTFYELVIKSTVTSDTGESVENGGFNIPFSTGGEKFDNFAIDIGANFGTSGQYMPPYVESMFPGPGMNNPPNSNIAVTFNDSMDSSTITTSNILLYKGDAPVTVTVALDTSGRIVTITPAASLAAGSYELRILGAVANNQGVPMRNADEAAEIAFSSPFDISGSADTTAATVYPMTSDDATGVPVNLGFIDFGFSKPLDPSTVNTTNITLTRGSNSVSATLEYDVGRNELSVMPTDILAPNTKYTVSFTTSVQDMAGNAIVAQSFSFTTGSMDSVAPRLQEARCDDYNCRIFFTEPMNNDRQTGDKWANSVINVENWTVENVTASSVIDITANPIVYNPDDFSIEFEGFAGFTAGNDFRITAAAAIKDLAGNAISTSNSDNIWLGVVEDSTTTYGSFGQDNMMFGPPVAGMMTGGVGGGGGMGGPGGKFDMGKAGGFGNFTAEEFMFGGAVEAFPFNQTAGQDVNVFQVRIPMAEVGLAPVDGDEVVLTFPNGTTITNTAQDSFSPFLDDFNQWEPGTITFDNTVDTDGIEVDTAARTATITLDVTGTPTANDYLTIDLRGITNPNVPKDPSSGGYTLGVKWKRAGNVEANLTSMPYFISEGGSNSITVKVYAGTATTGTAGADGNVFLFGGGPAGPMDKDLTLTDGIVTAADGDAIAGDAGVVYSNLNDGCYHIGTDPFVTLGGVDYFGQDFPEPICVFGGQDESKNIVLEPASGGGAVASVPVTVIISRPGGGFGGVDIDIFAGGPGRFIVKTLTNIDVPDPAGYTINLPQNGFWHVGVGPAMPKGPSAGPPDFAAFGSMPPPPMDLEVEGLPSSGAVSAGFHTPQNVSFNDSTDTVTFTVKASNIDIPVQVTDGTDGLANVDVFMHQQGFGGGAFGQTDSNGDVTLSVADYGPYEIGAFIPGLGDTHKQIDVKNDNGTKIYLDGALVATVPLKLAKADYTISGKVLDANNEPIPYAPVWAKNTDGNFVHGGTGQDGSYSFFVVADTWTLESDLPPSETSICGTFTKTVTITTESKANQNITPTNSTCYTLSGTVTVGGSIQANTFVFIESWDTENDRPSGGFHRPSNTDSTGAYSAEVPDGTYRVGTFDPAFGELSTTAIVDGSDQTANLNSGTTANITFAFTGGVASQNGFIEIKKSDDRHTRFSKQFNGADEDMVLNVKEGTYKYFVDVFGVGQFDGTVATGTTATIDLSTSTMVTLSGTIYDAADAPLPNATVSVHDFDEGVDKFVQTDENGDYSLEVKAGTYDMEVKRAGYVAPAAEVILTETTANYDFGGTDDPEQTAPIASDKTIAGTVYESDGTTPVTEGFVSAVNGDGKVINAPVDPTDGTYIIPVTADDDWEVFAAAPLHDETEATSVADTTSASVADKDITLTANAAKIPTAETKVITASTGGTFDSTSSDGAGMKLVAPGGALDTGQGDITISLERNFKPPRDDNFTALSGISNTVSATDSADQAIKDLSGSVELTFEYEPGDLPDGVTENDLTIQSYSPEAGAYVELSGVVRDIANNTITGLTNHFTEFVVSYPTSQVAAAPAPAPSSSGPFGSSTGGGGGGGGGVAVSSSSASSSNSTTNSTPATITTISGNQTYSQPVKVDTTAITTDTAKKTKTAAVTKAGTLTIKPNSNATIKLTVAKDTNVTAADSWDGKIDPPLVKTVGTVIGASGDVIKGSVQKLLQKDVAAVISVGSTTALTFSKKAKLEVPLSLTDNTKVGIYTSQDAKIWTYVSDAIVKNGSVTFETDHLTYFAFRAEGKGPSVGVTTGKVNAKTGFTDIVGHWGESYIETLFTKGIVKGKTSKAYAPNDYVTRAELTKVAIMAFGYNVPTVMENPFADVSKTAWYAPYVQAAKTMAIVKGVGGNKFAPNRSINRAEALKILIEAAGFDTSGKITISFKDTYKRAWYMKYVNFAKVNGIVSGYADGKFGPANNMTRAEMAKIIINVLNTITKMSQ